MDSKKWLSRKYPNSHKKILKFLCDYNLNEFKESGYNIGILVKDVVDCQKYKKSKLIMFKRSNPVNNENYPAHHAAIKCQKGYTSSGYHSITIYESDFKEITT